MILLEICAKASMPLLWYFVAAALTAEFPQSYNLPLIFSAQAHINFSFFFNFFYCLQYAETWKRRKKIFNHGVHGVHGGKNRSLT
jgi:hypothetical protein